MQPVRSGFPLPNHSINRLHPPSITTARSSSLAHVNHEGSHARHLQQHLTATTPAHIQLVMRRQSLLILSLWRRSTEAQSRAGDGRSTRQ